MRAHEFITEMTFRAGSYEPFLSKMVPYFANIYKTGGKHVGDIEHFNVFQYIEYPTQYAVFDQDKIAGFFIIEIDGTITAIYVLPEYRRKGLSSTVLHFCKRTLGYSKINFGKHQSNDMVEAIKHIYKLFDTYWEKDGPGEKIKYDPSTIDQFYDRMKKTEWKLVMENDGDFSEDPKFFTSRPTPGCLGSLYFCYLDEGKFEQENG